jgi:hypothetical protein
MRSRCGAVGVSHQCPITAISAMLIICTMFAAGGRSEGPPPPSLLVACPSTPFFFPGEWVSMQWMRDLVKDGVQVDYTTSLGDLNRTRLFGCVQTCLHC